MKKKLILPVSILVVLLICIPGFVMLIRDLVGVKFIFPLLGDGYLQDTFLTKDTYISFYMLRAWDPPNVLGWGIILAYLIFSSFGTFGFLGSKNTYSLREKYGSHGTSRFQTRSEIKNNFYSSKLGWFLGSLKPNQAYSPGMDAAYLPASGKLNMQVTVIGSPGSYKTTSLVLPNIFHIPYAYRNLDQKADLIITDPKSEVTLPQSLIQFFT